MNSEGSNVEKLNVKTDSSVKALDPHSAESKQKELKSKWYGQSCTVLLQQINNFKLTLVTSENVEPIKGALGHLFENLKEVSNILLEMKPLCNADEFPAMQSEYFTFDSKVSELADKSHKTIEILRQLQMLETQSVCSKGNESNVSDAEAYEVQKEAALSKVKLEFKEKFIAIEERKLELVQQQKKLELEAEHLKAMQQYDIKRSVQKICEKFVDCGAGDMHYGSDKTIKRVSVNENSFNESPAAEALNRYFNSMDVSSKSIPGSGGKEFVPGAQKHIGKNGDAINGQSANLVSSHATINSNIESLMVKLIEQNVETNKQLVKSSKGYKADVGIFSGEDVTEYPFWESAFNDQVDKETETAQDKCGLLRRKLAGDALDDVKGFLLLNDQDGYDKARSELRKVYGNECLLGKEFTDKLQSWNKIDASDGYGLRKFSNFLTQVLAAKRTVKSLGILDYASESCKVVECLPQFGINKWKSVVAKHRKDNGAGSYPPFKELCSFVSDLSDQENIPELNGLGIQRNETARSSQSERFKRANSIVRSTTSFSTVASTSSYMHICSYCKGEHHIEDCVEFGTKSWEEQRRFLSEERLCYGCGMFRNHISRDCKRPVLCKKCKGPHLTTLHFEKISKTSVNADVKCVSVCLNLGEEKDCDHAMIVPVWVRNASDPDKQVLTYCILDDQANTSFVSNSIVSRLKCKVVDTNYHLTTMHQRNALMHATKASGLQILSYDQSVSIDIPVAYTRDEIPLNHAQIPRKETAARWEHLIKIAEKLPPYFPGLDAGLLVGSNVSKAIRPREVLAGPDNAPYAQRSILGWGIIGMVCHSPQDGNKELTTHKVIFSSKIGNEEPKNVAKSVFAFQTTAKEVIQPQDILGMMELDFVERKSRFDSLSSDDYKFMNMLSNNIVTLENGHYQMPLPLKNENVSVPNNKPMAMKRLLQLKRRFKKSQTLFFDYIEFMDDIRTNYAEIVPDDESALENGKVNYIPHTCVYHPKKKKLRVVFDCAAKYENVCINDYVLQGPDQLNKLAGLLCRFRKENVAIMTDIKSMFFQFLVEPKHRNMLRFLWWKDNILDSEIIEYRMKVHLFGAASSPGCATFGLRRAADDGEEKFGIAAADFIRDSFYVDDGLTSLSNVDEALDLVQQTTKLCAERGLKLHKFVSNKKEILEKLPHDSVSEKVRSLDVPGHYSIERALEISWCVESDTFQFRIVLDDKPPTRRGILSTVCSIYDVFGFISPFVLRGKQILQELCKAGHGWDDGLPAEIKNEWEKWKLDVGNLNKFQISRCIKPENFGKVSRTPVKFLGRQYYRIWRMLLYSSCKRQRRSPL